MINQPKRYVGYVRVSSEEQRKHGLSPDYQEQKIREYVALKDGQMVALYSDLGKSGGNIKRTGFKEMMQAAHQNQFTHMVFLKLDRFSRSIKDTILVMEELKDLNIQIQSIDGEIDTTTPTGEAFFHFTALMAQLERSQAKERTEVIHEHIVEQGRAVNPPPFGYTRQRKKWIINEKEAAIVKAIFEAAANGERLPILCQTYNISRSTLYYMLRNTTYIGKITYKGTEYDGKHEPIISMDLWERVNTKRTYHSRMHNRVSYSKSSYNHEWKNNH